MKNLTTKIALGLVLILSLVTVGQVAFARIYNPSASGSSGVTSVGVGDTNSTLTFTGSPVTTTGTINGTLNLGHTNTWTILQNFNYSSTTGYASFANASSTLFSVGTLTIPNLGTAAGSFIAVNATGQVIATTSPSGGSSAFSAITGSTNTTAAMVVGTGASISASGSGSITATTNANLTGVITSSGNTTSLGSAGSVNSSQMATWNSDETGTGAAVYASGPFITSPIIVTDSRIPIINGGAAAGSTLDLRSTSAAGTTDAILFKTASQVERARFITSGQLGIATTTPYYTFTVASTSGAQIAISAGAGISQWTFRAETDGGLDIASTTVAGTATSSVVALGVTSGGILKLGNYANCNGATNALGITSGLMQCDSGVSDQRLKKDITPIADGLSTIMALKPVTFFWKDLTNHNTSSPLEQYGFIAQDIQPILPSAIGQSPDGYLTLDKTVLIAPLVQAVQAQQKEIDELKAEVKALKK